MDSTMNGSRHVHCCTVYSIIFPASMLTLAQTISSQYRQLSSHYGWSYRPHFPSIIGSHFKTPSNTTLRLENGEIDHVPANLKKTTPNFHLIMPSERDTEDFCKSTLSAMLLNYPPPTIVNLHATHPSDTQWERDILASTLHYLSNKKLVQDHDLVLIVDGQQSWFQLPSDVIIAQYKKILEDANIRLLKKYGLNKQGFQRFNQTIVFAAEKSCVNDDMACRYVPPSTLPLDTYGTDTANRIADRPAKFINSKMVMGPAGDLRKLYKVALIKFQQNRSQTQTVQSVFATLFGEQQLRRNAAGQDRKPVSAKFSAFFSGVKRGAGISVVKRRLQVDVARGNSTRHEFSIGLDYTHTLFQPLDYCTEEELVPLMHDNSTSDLTEYIRPGSWVKELTLPQALSETRPPFWRPDLIRHNPSPNLKPAYIDKLEFATDLDSMPKRKTPWHSVELVQNTYTGAVPAILQNTAYARAAERPPAANITWDSLWFAQHRRALLRNYLRKQQSSDSYHNSLVGGDRSWDVRGGRGGVWTEAEQIWHPWGETDGVCGSVSQINSVFSDKKGVWLHEKDETAEQDRLAEEFTNEDNDTKTFLAELEKLKAQDKSSNDAASGEGAGAESEDEQSGNLPYDEEERKKQQEEANRMLQEESLRLQQIEAAEEEAEEKLAKQQEKEREQNQRQGRQKDEQELEDGGEDDDLLGLRAHK